MAEPDKKIESINALKNANKHLADVFNELAKKDQVLQTNASNLQRVAAQCGDLFVSVWIGQKQEHVSLKNYLNTIATSLNDAR